MQQESYQYFFFFCLKSIFFLINACYHLTMLSVNLAADKLMTFFLFSLENRIWHFMQIVSTGDNLHEMSKTIF